MTVTLRRATDTDIPFIMACERQPGYAAFVGSWPDTEHLSAMNDPDWRYLIGARDCQDGGFVMLRGMSDRNRNMYLKRIAVHDADTGFGRPFLAAVIDWVFTNTNSHRFWLEVVENNARARHVYRSLGFIEEGILRETFDDRETGRRGNFRVMSILRPEWKT